MGVGSEAERIAILGWADKLEERFRTLIEFGLVREEIQADAVLKPLTAARKLARDGQVDEAAESLDRAELGLQTALHARRWIWRAWHVHQAGIFIYDVVAILFLLNVASGYLGFVATTLWEKKIPVPVATVVAGAMGASLRGIWYLWRQVSKGIFRAQFTLAQLAAPWIGALFGLFTYLLLKASLLAVKGGETAKLEESALPLAFAFLAGYSWEWILARIEQVRSATGSTSSVKVPNAPPATLPSATPPPNTPPPTTPPSTTPPSTTPPPSTAPPTLPNSSSVSGPDHTPR